MHLHRMRNLIVPAGLGLLLTALLGTAAQAARIRPTQGSTYPEIAGAITGKQSYAFDPATGRGMFQFNNVPYVLMLGPKVTDEFPVGPTDEGLRGQTLRLTLDQAGRLIDSPENSFALYGTVVVGGQTYQGLLLQGTPTAFAAQAGPAPTFDLNLTVTGGALARTFGADVSLELRATAESSCSGDFSKSFSTTIARSQTIGYHAPNPTAGPQSTALVVLIACGSWLVLRRPFRRVAHRELLLPDCV